MYQVINPSIIAAQTFVAATGGQLQYDTLWAARQRGPTALSKALKKSVTSNLPTKRDEIVTFSGMRGFLPVSTNFNPSAPQDYKDLYPLPTELAQNFASERTKLNRDRFAVAAVVGAGIFVIPGFTGLKWLMIAILSPLTGEVCSLIRHKQRHAHNEQAVRDWIKSDEAPDVAVMIHAASQEAYFNNRNAEHHFMALIAERFFEEASDETEAAQAAREKLAHLAKIRGSHHAAHYRWILRQRGFGEPETDLGRWNYNRNLLWRSEQGDVVAQDIINLGIRESAFFRTDFLDHVHEEGISLQDNAAVALAQRLSNQE